MIGRVMALNTSVRSTSMCNATSTTDWCSEARCWILTACCHSSVIRSCGQSIGVRLNDDIRWRHDTMTAWIPNLRRFMECRNMLSLQPDPGILCAWVCRDRWRHAMAQRRECLADRSLITPVQKSWSFWFRKSPLRIRMRPSRPISNSTLYRSPMHVGTLNVSETGILYNLVSKNCTPFYFYCKFIRAFSLPHCCQKPDLYLNP